MVTARRSSDGASPWSRTTGTALNAAAYAAPTGVASETNLGSCLTV